MRVLGLDGCPGGWAGALVTPEGITLRRYDGWSLREPLAADVDLIAVDIPIGLPPLGSVRGCDKAARNVLGLRRSSVFPAPPRELLGIDGHAATTARGRELGAGGVSIQAYNIFGRIAAVDASITPADQRRVVEVHPEVAFFELAGLDLGSKRHRTGRDAREAALRAVWPDVAPQLFGAKPDDVLDALVCAWTGLRWLAGTATLLPADPPRDARGLLMAIAA